MVLEDVMVSRYRQNLLLHCYGAAMFRKVFEAVMDPLCINRLISRPQHLSSIPKWFWADGYLFQKLDELWADIAEYSLSPLSAFMDDIRHQQICRGEFAILDEAILRLSRSLCARAWDPLADQIFKDSNKVAFEIVRPLHSLYRVSHAFNMCISHR